MKRAISLTMILLLSVSASAAFRELPTEIMGISIGMSRADAQTRLQSLGSLERETRKRQEVWAIKDARISYLLVGYDPELRVRYVTAIARNGGPRIRYDEVADVKSAERVQNQGNYKLTWQMEARSGQSAYALIAHGHDAQYLDSYSLKKVGEEKD